MYVPNVDCTVCSLCLVFRVHHHSIAKYVITKQCRHVSPSNISPPIRNFHGIQFLMEYNVFWCVLWKPNTVRNEFDECEITMIWILLFFFFVHFIMFTYFPEWLCSGKYNEKIHSQTSGLTCVYVDFLFVPCRLYFIRGKYTPIRKERRKNTRVKWIRGQRSEAKCVAANTKQKCRKNKRQLSIRQNDKQI